ISLHHHPISSHLFPTRRSSDLAAARIPFIACWKRRIVEIIATGSLQKIAADGGHVSQLRTCTRQQRLTQNRVARFNQRVLGQIRSEEHTSELQSRFDLVCRLLL